MATGWRWMPQPERSYGSMTLENRCGDHACPLCWPNQAIGPSSRATLAPLLSAYLLAAPHSIWRSEERRVGIESKSGAVGVRSLQKHLMNNCVIDSHDPKTKHNV